MKALTWILVAFSLFCSNLTAETTASEEGDDQKVLLAILVRNKAHLLPYFLRCIENLDYNKKNLSLYINTNNNKDETQEILLDWLKSHENLYRSVCYEKTDYVIDASTPHEWTNERLKTLAKIRNRSLQKTKETGSDFYFVVDCNNFIAPFTLKELIRQNKPMIAPMLRSIPEPGDAASNFFCAVDDNGYYRDSPDYLKILRREKVGTFKVPVVHCTYLIKAECLDKLDYYSENGEYEFIVFSRRAREQGVDQYICNEKEFGTNVNFHTKLTLEQEKERLQSLPLSSFMLQEKKEECVLGATRTRDLLLRRQPLYPPELREHDDESTR